MTNELFKIREELLSAALEVAASRLYLNVQDPGPHDDAQAELHDDVFEQAVTQYYLKRQGEHEREILARGRARQSDACARGVHSVYHFVDDTPTCSDCGADCWEQHRDLL